MNTNIENLLDRTAEYLLKYDASEEGQKCAHEIQDYYEYRPNYILGCLDYARKFAHKAQTIDIDEDPNEFISVANKAYHAWASSMKTQNENIKKNKIKLTESKLKQIVAESVKRILNEDEYWPGDVNPRVLQAVQQDGIKRQMETCNKNIDEYLEKIRLFAKSGNASQVMYYAEQIETCAKLINRFKPEIK